MFTRLLLATTFLTVLSLPVDAQGRSERCRELRQACLMKGSLGERGEGNCKRYREQCQSQGRDDDCSELRRACLNKGQLGERGEGNCRRYRERCQRGG